VTEQHGRRIVDLMSPIGKGKRGLIVSPPRRADHRAEADRHVDRTNNPGVHLIVLLGRRAPEEVTDMRRSVKARSCRQLSRPSDEHTQVAELTIERAKRMVEAARTW